MPIEIESPEQMGYDKIRNNLSESSYTDTFLRDIEPGNDWKDLLLAYGPHAGHEGLRELIVKGSTLHRDDVLLTLGAAAGLFIIATSLLEKEDELIVVRPNYATNIETPRAIGATIRFIDLVFEEGFRLDPDKVRRSITRQTRYISVTYPHNPTGVCITDAEMKELVAIAVDHNLYLLVDETYRDMIFHDPLPVAAEYSDKVISLGSLSKTYGLPGLRAGWIITRDRALLETFLAAKEQIHICGPILEEALAFRYMQQRDHHLVRIREDIRRKFGLVKKWMDDQRDFEWIEPGGGVVAFPRLRDPHSIDIVRFYDILLKKYGTYVGPGHWFDMPEHYMRVGYGWPSVESLQAGLEALTKSVLESRI